MRENRFLKCYAITNFKACDNVYAGYSMQIPVNFVSFLYRQSENEYDYITTRPMVYESVNPLVPYHKQVTMVEKPAYQTTVLANKANVKPNECEIINLQPATPNTDDVKMEKNPAYAETNFN